MAVLINSNIASLQAQRRLAESSQRLGITFERLGSGFRINRASDDAAGLAIASSLNADTRVYTQAIRNLSDGISTLSVAEGSVNQGANLLIRMRELAVQSSNGVYSAVQRRSIYEESHALTLEFNRLIASTNFNGLTLLDRSLDSMSIQAGYSTLSLSLGNELSRSTGTGEFGNETNISALGVAHSTQSKFSDLNGDGNLDIVTVGRNGPLGSASTVVGYALGNGNGTFGSATTVTLTSAAPGSFLSELEIADVNNDGSLDIVFGGIASSVSLFGVMLGNGNGTFQQAATTSLGGSGLNGLTVGDINGDSILDVVLGDDNASGIARASAFFGNGNGTFSSAGSYLLASTATSGVSELHLADLDNDGRLDIVTLGNNDSGTKEINILRGLSDGTFASRVSQQVSSSGNQFEISDFNNDGYLDLITTATDAVANIYFGRSDGTFGAPVSISPGLVTNLGLTITDYNDDGYEDLLVGGDQKLLVYSGKGDGTFTLEHTVNTSIANLTSINVGDLNNDGSKDLIINDLIGGSAALVTQTAQQVTSLQDFNLSRRDEALQAISQIDAALERVHKELSAIGVMQSRLETAKGHLFSTTLNYSAAAKRITDTDIAAESAQLVRGRILQQTSAAVLSQASLLPQLAIQLINGT